MSDFNAGRRAGLLEAVALAEKWRDEARAEAAKARKRERLHGIGGYDAPQMAEQLDGAATECNALAGELRELAEQVPL